MNFKHYLKEQFYNNTLHTRFWNEQKEMDPTVREKLLTIAMNFAEDCGVDEYVQDIQLTGSLANYNYTKYSDLDVHILLDFADVDKNEELVKSALDGRRFIWNVRHDIIIRDHEVELYFQDVDEPHMASGLYSLTDDQWLRVPKYDPPEIDNADVQTKANQIKRDIDRLEQKVDEIRDPSEIDELQKIANKIRNKIHKMRKDSLQREGEFGVGNLAFKELRNSKYIEKIIKIDSKLYDELFNEENFIDQSFDSYREIVY